MSALGRKQTLFGGNSYFSGNGRLCAISSQSGQSIPRGMKREHHAISDGCSRPKLVEPPVLCNATILIRYREHATLDLKSSHNRVTRRVHIGVLCYGWITSHC